MAAAQRLNFPLLLVNRCEARRYWRRYGCTGAEVIHMQRARELKEVIYNGYGEPPASDGKGGGGPTRPVTPAPVGPKAVA